MSPESNYGRDLFDDLPAGSRLIVPLAVPASALSAAGMWFYLERMAARNGAPDAEPDAEPEGWGRRAA